MEWGLGWDEAFAIWMRKIQMLKQISGVNEFHSPLHCSFSPHESTSVYEFERLLLVDDLTFHTSTVSAYAFSPVNGSLYLGLQCQTF